VLLIWSFLACFMIGVEYRFIGISMTAVTFSIVFLFLISRVKEAMFIKAEDFKLANIRFF